MKGTQVGYGVEQERQEKLPLPAIRRSTDRPGLLKCRPGAPQCRDSHPRIRAPARSATEVPDYKNREILYSLAFHNRFTMIFPVSMMSATNSTGTCTG